MRKDRADFAKELGDKDGGVAPRRHRSTTAARGESARARAHGTCGVRRVGRSERVVRCIGWERGG